MRIFSDQGRGLPTRPREGVLVRKQGKRGMALLMVVTTIAVLTSLVVEFAYDTHVDLRLAAAARDELRAHYLARSATTFGRLLLGFQFQLDKQGKNLPPGLPGIPGGINLRLWELIPIESDAITGFVEAIKGESDPSDVPPPPLSPSPGEAVPAAGLQDFGSFQGGFIADIRDEESKINLNRLTFPGATGSLVAMQLFQLVSDPRWDFLFNEDNLHRERITRQELILRLKDWADEDEVETIFEPSTGVLGQGFGDEERYYTRYTPRYRPKNSLFVSMDEIHLVAGMSDRLMAAFGDRLTVFPDINSPLNVNTDDMLQLMMILRLMAVDPLHPAFTNPMTMELILQQIRSAKVIPGMGITVEQLAQILEGNGIPVKPEFKHNISQSGLGHQSETFTIRATGRVGEVEKTLVTVIRYGEGLGQALYFREE